MSATVLWYIHDHGSGHLARARAVIPRLQSRVVVAVGPAVADEARDTLDVAVVELPSDIAEPGAPTRGPWHHAPSSPAVRARTLALADVVARHACSTAVVDVSMEVTVLARLLGLRVVTLRQSGHRDDDAHRIGFASADAVWVPQHPALEPVTPADHWTFTGAFSRYDPMPPPVRTVDGERLALLLVGAGGSGFDADPWREAKAPTGWRVRVVGAADRWCTGAVHSVGRVDPVLPLLRRADAVIAGAGWASVAEAATVRVPLAVVPEERPFDEQVVRADALREAELAVVLDEWPTPAALGDVLDAVVRLDPERWDQFHDGRGAERAATLIERNHAA